MSKPLELTVHPRRLVATGFVRWNGDGTSTDLHVEEWLIDGEWVRGPFRTHKRLTDAELAAEYWQAFSGVWDGHGKKARLRREVLKRFATTRSYDE